jgi:hypothetical protein
MIFYHGTTEVIFYVDFNKSRLRTDFGRGFYISSKRGTAQDWAVGKAGFSGIPTVMRYEINNAIFTDNALEYKRFDSPTVEWLDFIRDNRRTDIVINKTLEPRHSYDIVSGPIANDMVADVVDFYCKGKISADDAIARAKALPRVFQLSLHTPLSLMYISSVMYSQRKGSKWSSWTPIN